jgi:uncharacterized cupredoxin-like copper-binding protein
MRRSLIVVATVVLGAGLLTACGDDDNDVASSVDDTESTPTTGAADDAGGPTKVDVTAKDYAFDLPASIKGGVVQLAFTNAGKEPHFAGFSKIDEGKTFEDAKAALTAPEGQAPAGPPPFEDIGGIATADPGVGTTATFALEAGSYAVYCQIPAPDGVSHAAKGMVSELTVTEGGAAGEVPDAVSTVTAQDFALSAPSGLTAGPNVVAITNQGKQLHEINLVEVADGKTIQDVVAWFGSPAGPPPMRSLSGVAVKVGEEGTAKFDLEADKTYALVCAIPDVLGDFAPHMTKGMYTRTFKVPG